MNEELDKLRNDATDLYEKEKNTEIIALLTDEVLEQFKDAELYALRSRALFRLKDDENKVMYYAQKAVDTDSNFYLGYFARGCSWHMKGEFNKAIEDYNKAIELKPDDAILYYNIGNAWSDIGNFEISIKNYKKAIDLKSDFSNAYYNSGLAKKIVAKEFDESIKDFEKFLELTPVKDDIWFKRASGFIKELLEKKKDIELNKIGDLTSKIKRLLLITEGCVTHYTGLSVVKKLILEDNNKFKISEGAFLNDTSEGTELFKFLEYQFSSKSSDGLVAETFAPKPFIGSFVTENKYDDLNMWRFYGKEKGIEAKGCAITLRISEFIEAINLSITKGDEKSDKSSEDDINFYRVAYWNHDLDTINLHIPNSKRKVENELNKLMKELKEKVSHYKVEDKSVLEKYLNSIAFLFKSDAYKNENELRLVIKGIEFEKMYDMDANPPRVYIELVNIRELIEQITLGPKVDKSDEWAAAIYYSYDKETDETKKPKKILISHLPYK